MSTYEASFKTTDPITGETKLNRLFTMRAPNAQQVAARANALGLPQSAQGELIVYRF